MGAYYIKESDFRTFARDKNKMINGNDLKEKYKKTWGPCISCDPIPWHVVNNKGNTKPVFGGKGNKYNQIRNLG